jgi:hypothetical protein
MQTRRHIIVDPQDNVTTLLDELVECAVLEGGAPVAPGIPFGHKAALVGIPAGAEVIKYGVKIGHALEPIAAGEHVHVHNCK